MDSIRDFNYMHVLHTVHVCMEGATVAVRHVCSPISQHPDIAGPW